MEAGVGSDVHEMGGPEPSADEAVSFALFGGVRVVRGGAEVELTRPKQRALLALLLSTPGEPVYASEIVDVLWPGEPGASVANQIHRHVGSLRRAFQPGLPLRQAGRYLLPAGTGYRLVAGPGGCDVLRFRGLVQEADRLARAGKGEEAGRAYRSALAVASAPPGEDTMRALPAFVGLEDERVRAIIAAAGHCESADDFAAVLPGLRAAAACHRLNEALHAQLITALTRTGRAAEALEVYAQIRRELRDELGSSPGAALEASQAQALRGEDRPRPDEPTGPSPGGATRAAALTAGGFRRAPGPCRGAARPLGNWFSGPGHHRDGRSGQDHPGAPPGRRTRCPPSRRPGLREPARVRCHRAAGRSAGRAARHARGPGSSVPGASPVRGRPVGLAAQPALGAAGPGGARQRPRLPAGRTTAPRSRPQPGDHHQPPPDARPDRVPPGPPRAAGTLRRRRGPRVPQPTALPEPGRRRQRRQRRHGGAGAGVRRPSPGPCDHRGPRRREPGVPAGPARPGVHPGTDAAGLAQRRDRRTRPRRRLLLVPPGPVRRRRARLRVPERAPRPRDPRSRRREHLRARPAARPRGPHRTDPGQRAAREQARPLRVPRPAPRVRTDLAGRAVWRSVSPPGQPLRALRPRSDPDLRPAPVAPAGDTMPGIVPETFASSRDAFRWYTGQRTVLHHVCRLAISLGDHRSALMLMLDWRPMSQGVDPIHDMLPFRSEEH